MATTTPNYGWDVPTSTDYVADGAVAIETLGDDIDATLYTALGGAYPGLRLIKTQTIGSGVASVTVTDAFSATYNNYKIMVANGVGSTSAFLRLQLGASTADYNCSLNSVIYASNTALLQTTLNGSSWLEAGWTSADYIALNVDLINPNLSKRTLMSAAFPGTSVAGHTAGYHNANTSFTAFTLTANTGTLTGGTIYVYGYGAS
jgi:hypothetical protein